MAIALPPIVATVALVAFVAPACLISSSEAADMVHTSGRDVVVASSPAAEATAKQIADIQQHLLGVMAVKVPAADAVDALTQSLLTARGPRLGHETREGAASMAALAVAVSQVLAQGALAEEELERLAQDLYVASSNRALPDRDAGLLAIDVALILQEAGADMLDVTNVLTALQRICPGAKMPATGIPIRPAPRALATLSRQ